MKLGMYVTAVIATVALALGASIASGATRPDDRAAHGPGAVTPDALDASVRPDDRPVHGTGSVWIVETAGLMRPDDRPNHGVGYVGAEPIRPDDRAWRGVGADPGSVPTQSAADGLGFDWVDAGIGAGAALGLVALLAGSMVLAARRRETAMP